ncbi:MAG TPA: YdeI/OmpD-associated family protein [Prosthecobacter sp.]
MDCARTTTRDPEAWLDNAPEFSQAMARQVRDWILRWEPDLTESIKWNMICFSGRKLVCAISACKKHLGVSFFRGVELREMTGTDLFVGGEASTSIQTLRITDPKQLNATQLRRLVQAAVALDADESIRPPPPKKKAEWPMPEVLAKALKKNKAAAANFEAFKPTYQREYKVWVSTAKQPETIQKRVDETVRALAKGLKWIDRKKG